VTPSAPKLILWTGPQHAGKTTAAADLADEVRRRGLSVAGMLAPGVYREGRLVGFDAVDLRSGRRASLLRRGRDGPQRAGPFAFTQAGLALGKEALGGEAVEDAGVVIVDEFGPLELAGGGWRGAVDALLGSTTGVVVLIVRDRIVERVRRLYAALLPVVISAAAAGAVAQAMTVVDGGGAARRP
jgi:iron complex transport system ATP-binding protein